MKKILGTYISIPAIFRNRYKHYTYSRKINLETAKKYCKIFINKVCGDSQELSKYKDQKISELEEKLNGFESSLINKPFFDYLHQFLQINVHLDKKDGLIESRLHDLKWFDVFVELRQISKGELAKYKLPKIKLTFGIQPRVYGVPGGDFGELDSFIDFYKQFTKAKRNFTKILKILPSSRKN